MNAVFAEIGSGNNYVRFEPIDELDQFIFSLGRL